jgi:hypothetical protein
LFHIQGEMFCHISFQPDFPVCHTFFVVHISSTG